MNNLPKIRFYWIILLNGVIFYIGNVEVTGYFHVTNAWIAVYLHRPG